MEGDGERRVEAVGEREGKCVGEGGWWMVVERERSVRAVARCTERDRVRALWLRVMG